MRPVLLILLISGISLTTTAQTAQKKLDSLIAELPDSKEDTNKVLLLAAISDNYFQTDPSKGITYGEQTLELATQLKYNYGIVKGNNLIARCYAIQSNFPPALKYYQAALAKAREMNNPRMVALLSVSLGAVYTSNNEYDKAYKYLIEGKKAFEKAGIKNTVSLMINLGHLFIKQAKYKEALDYYLQGIKQEEEKAAPTADLAILYSNVGGVYVEILDYVNALSYLFKALPLQQDMGNDKSVAYTLSKIGRTYRHIAEASLNKLPDSLKNKTVNLKKSEYYLSQSVSICRNLGMRDVLAESYASLSDVYNLQGDYKNAYSYHLKYTSLKDSLRDIKHEKEFAKIEAEFHVQKTTDSLKYLNVIKDKELKQKKFERNGYVLLAALTGVISLLLINRQKQKRKIAEADTQRAEEMARLQLNDFTKNIHEKNELIEKISSDIEKYRQQILTQSLPPDYDLLNELQQSILLTDEQWDKFKNTFEKVHKGYMMRLKNKLPDITPAETRFIVLSKLKLSNKEMASMLGISPQGVRVHKHRLMKKLGLEGDNLLDDLIHQI